MNRGEVSGTAGAITDGQIAGLIHCYAAHPSPKWVGWIKRRERALLLNHRRPTWIAHFIPAHPGARRAAASIYRLGGMIEDQRFVGTEVSIRHPEHEPVAENIEKLWRLPRSAVLRHAVVSGVRDLALVRHIIGYWNQEIRVSSDSGK
jgi:hypothetical protein